MLMSDSLFTDDRIFLLSLLKPLAAQYLKIYQTVYVLHANVR